MAAVASLKTLVFLPVDHPEVDQAFRALPGGAQAYNQTCGEGWQYMGTARIETGRLVGRYQHEFRHRAHPATGKREYRTFLSLMTDEAAQAFPGLV